MWDDQHHCPTCGAPLPIRNRFVRIATCEFCENVCVIIDGNLKATGRTATLTSMPTMFRLDARGELGGRAFTVLGRLRYDHGDGYWDEWFLSFQDGTCGWLQEDEGNFTYFDRIDITEQAPTYESLRVGDEFYAGEAPVMVTEKGTAVIAGGEGQLGFLILPGDNVRYIDGSDGMQKASIEYGNDEVEICMGQAVPRQDLTVEKDPWEQ